MDNAMGNSLVNLLDSDLSEIVAALCSKRITAPFSSFGLGRFLSPSIASEVAKELQILADQGFTEDQIATTLRLLLVDRNRTIPITKSIELVTTGPEAPGTANRDTSVVVRELFSNAEESVLVAGYAVRQGQKVFQALADRMRDNPSLKVQLFLNINRGYGDTSKPSELIRRFKNEFCNNQWPKERPLPEVFYDPRSVEFDPKKRAALHAKCVVIDKDKVFISSANFTEAAHQRNLEIGLQVFSRNLAERIVLHFNTLREVGLLCRL